MLKSNPVLKIFLEGLYDEDCNLSKLRGCPHLAKQIWMEVRNFWKANIILPPEVGEDESRRSIRFQITDFNKESFKSELFLAPIFSSYLDLEDAYADWEKESLFPSPSDININMMPFTVGVDFRACQLPPYLEQYWPLIQACLNPHLNRIKGNHSYQNFCPVELIPSDIGKVYYLTIQESWVEAGDSQRRPDLHVDSPGYVKIKGEHEKKNDEGNGKSQRYCGHHWGDGCAHYVGHSETNPYVPYVSTPTVYAMQGGIYIASSVSGSTRVWNCSVQPEVVGSLGDIEHLRSLLPGEGKVLDPEQLYWITDKTPHESLSLSKRTYRQFFRLVTADVSFWQKDHSTANPLGVKPDPNVTKIVIGDKFSKEGIEIVEY